MELIEVKSLIWAQKGKLYIIEFSGQPSQSGGKKKGIVLICLTLCLQIPSNEPQQKTYFQQTNYKQ